MKIFFLLIFISLSARAQNCSVTFANAVNAEKVTFYNTSNTNNAHFYWTFGDGTSSSLFNPTHEFPCNGKYLVTLFAKDTLSSCSNFFQSWIEITQYPQAICIAHLRDTIYSLDSIYDQIILWDSTNFCQNYSTQFGVAGNWGFGNTNQFYLSKWPASHVAALNTYNNISESLTLLSVENRLNKAKNFSPCSANFEFSILSEDTTGQTFFFKAMNNSAASYKWYFTGFGDPIISHRDTATIKYPGNPFSYQILPPVYLITADQNGCRDSSIQSISRFSYSKTFVGIKENGLDYIKITLYPNPFINKLTLDYKAESLNIKSIEVENTLGQLVKKLACHGVVKEIDLSFLETGIYYLKICNDKEYKFFKIVKE